MPIEHWSDNILVVDLQDDPAFSDDVTALIEQSEGGATEAVILDFRSVTYVNSSNIAKLLKLRKKLLTERRRLVLCEINTNVWGLFLVTGLDKVFEFADNVAVALTSLQLASQQQD